MPLYTVTVEKRSEQAFTVEAENKNQAIERAGAIARTEGGSVPETVVGVEVLFVELF